jgi:hypothetical protein
MHRCVDCGFLGAGEQEIVCSLRVLIAKNEYLRPFDLICGRRVRGPGENDLEVHDWTLTTHKCKFFMKYQPGYSPRVHQELWRDEITRRSTRNTTLIGVVLGAMISTMAQVIVIMIR